MKILLTIALCLIAVSAQAGVFIPVNYITASGAVGPTGPKGDTGAFTNKLTDTLNCDSYVLTNIGPVYEDLILLGSARNGATAPTFADRGNGVYMFRFDNANHELSSYSQMPHAWDKRTLHPHLHWESRASETITATVQMNYVYSKISTGSIVDSGTISANINGSFTSGQLQYLDIGHIDLPTPTLSEVINFRLKVTPFTAGSGIWIWGWDVHYGRNRLGSNSEAAD